MPKYLIEASYNSEGAKGVQSAGGTARVEAVLRRTTGGALPEVVGDAGVLVPPGDHQALTTAILDLLGNRDKAGELGRKGYRRIQEHFTWKKAAEKTVDAYREVIRDYRGL